MKRWLRYWVGRYRLAWKYCPVCNSSPPKMGCWVCEGSYDYGSSPSGLGGPLSAERALLWRTRWDRVMGR
ncbi:hypothetical protein [Longimicrobium sp.]|jgi:hypothetical protein|uniref:hypothetical protein n=1 Tax=Longimicrobium sp. TaxID=2029185 RepID=UPI002ED897DA